jgi:small-conductance mechanosensitive channel
MINLLTEMELWNNPLLFLLKEWFLGIVTLISTFLLVALTRSVLKRLGSERKWHILHQLAPSISNVLYVIGLKLCIEFLPLNVRIETWLFHILYVFSILIYLTLARRAALLAIEWNAQKKSTATESLQQGFLPLLKNMVTLFLFFTAGIMLLKHFSYDVMSLITALGVGSLAVGLAAKDTLSHMISGFILIIDQNLRPGDRINLSGTVGDVKEIGLRSTQIRVGDGNTLVVPNSELVNTKILNLSLPSRATSCTSSIRIPYDVPFQTIKIICLEVFQGLEQADQSRAPGVNLASISEGNQLITIGFWVNDFDKTGPVLTLFNEALLARLKQEKIPLISVQPNA